MWHIWPLSFKWAPQLVWLALLYEHFMHWCLQKTTQQHIRLKQSNPDQPVTSCICKRKATWSDPLNHPQSETLLSHGNVSSSLCAAVPPLPLHCPPTPTVHTVLFVGKPVTGRQVVCDWLSRGPLSPSSFSGAYAWDSRLVCVCAAACSRQEKRGRETGARHWGRLEEEE